MSKLKYGAEQCDAIQLYLWRLRDALRLSHWDVFLSAKAAERHCDASVYPTEGRWVAEVRVGQGFWFLPDEEKRSTLTHELLHLTHRGVAEVLRKHLFIGGYLPRRAYLMAWEAQRLELELMVDHLTTVIAPTMPVWTGIQLQEEQRP